MGADEISITFAQHSGVLKDKLQAIQNRSKSECYWFNGNQVTHWSVYQ